MYMILIIGYLFWNSSHNFFKCQQRITVNGSNEINNFHLK